VFLPSGFRVKVSTFRVQVQGFYLQGSGSRFLLREVDHKVVANPKTLNPKCKQLIRKREAQTAQGKVAVGGARGV